MITGDADNVTHTLYLLLHCEPRLLQCWHYSLMASNCYSINKVKMNFKGYSNNNSDETMQDKQLERAVQSIFVIFFQWVVPGYQEQYIKKIQYSKNDEKYTFQVGKSQKMHFLEQILDKYDVEVLRDLVGLLFLRSYLLCSSFKQKLTTLARRKLSVLLRSRQTQSQ